MAGVIGHGRKEGEDGRKRKHDTGYGDNDDNDDDDDDDKNKETEYIEKKVPRLDIDLNSLSALILCERWGSPIHGGIAAALYQLIDQLKSCGLTIHCTVLEEDANAVREAERLGVTLVSPARKPLFEKEKPSYIWLQAHDTFFPHLKKIQGLMFVFGFGVTSSAVALDIRDNVVPDSEYIHVNVWNPEELCHEMFPYGKEVFEHKCKLLDEQSHRAFAVLSMGPKVFDHFDYRYDDDDSPVKHLQLLPLPEECYFEIPLPRKLPDSPNFRIMTPFEHFAVSGLNHSSVVPTAFNIMAESYDQFKKLGDPPKWEIICMNKHDDQEIGARLKPHAKLTLISKGFQNDSFIKDVRHSHLVVVPPQSKDSLTLIVTMIAMGKPILVPSASEGDIFISKYFVDYRPHVVVEMRGSPDALKDQMIRIVQDYQMYLNQASKMREMLKTTVIEQMKGLNSLSIKAIQKHLQRATSGWHIPNPLSTESNGSERGNSLPSTSAGSLSISQSAPSSDRELCTIGVQVGTSQGHAVNGASMLNVDDGFNQREGNRPTTEGMGRVLSDVHNGLEVTKVDRGCLRYVMKCRSLDALEALWSEYISGRLDKTIHSTIITPTLLSKIQAHYLTLDIYIPVQEYLLCKRELPLITGSVQTPSRRRSVAAITELKAARREDITRHHTVDSLNLVLTQIQIRDNQTIYELLSRDDFSVEELQGHRSTFVTKQWKVRPDVYFKEAKFGQSQSTKEQHIMTLKDEASSFYKVEDEFVQLKIHASKHSATSKAVLHEAGQKLAIQSEDITNQAIPVKEKYAAGKAEFEKMQSDVERVNQGYPVKESVLEVFGEGSMPGQFDEAGGIHIKNNFQWVICDRLNHRVQVIDPIKLCCDLILQFHTFQKSFYPVDVTVDEDNDQYFMSDQGNGQVVVSSGQSKILNCFGRKEGIDPTGICLSPEGFIFIGDWKGYVRKYNKSGEHIARTEKGQVRNPWDLIVNKKWIFVSDGDRQCVHVLNHQMQTIRDIGKGHLERPLGLCFDHQQDGIYVCDIRGHRVVHFNCDGEFLSYKGQGQLEYPHYIALCKDNPYRLVVTQYSCIKLLYI